METTASALGVKPVTIVLTDMEKTAAKMIPRPTAKVRANGYRGYSQLIEQVPKEERDKYPLPQMGPRGFRGGMSELQCLINGSHSILDIKKMLDAQTPQKMDLEHVINYIQILRLAGLVEIK
jgi:hypothetical protein